MSCTPGTDCAPCQDCPPASTPVMPRCNVVLIDGVFTNATLVVDNGCITSVAQGNPFNYTPDACCAVPGGGGEGGAGLDGPPGPPGAGATVSIGSVTSLAFGSPPTVVNTGTPTNAILAIGIPRGEDGADGAAPTGVTNNTAGIEINNGQVQGLPITWPPVLLATISPVDVATVTFTASKNALTGEVVFQLSLAAFEQALKDYADAAVLAATTPLQTQITAIQAQLAICCP